MLLRTAALQAPAVVSMAENLLSVTANQFPQQMTNETTGARRFCSGKPS
jgi:hypothetical protein